MVNIIRNIIYQHKVKQSIKQANELHALTNKRYFVMALGRKIQLFTKQDLKFLVATRKFRKGVGIADLERIAIYTTI